MSEISKAVVLLSGGIDSATCMALACRDYDYIIPVHFRYGQQTDDLELEMAKGQRNHLDSKNPVTKIEPLQVVNYTGVFAHFAEGVAEPGKDFDHLTEDDGRSSGYVPMRNLHLIATGAAIADTRDASAVYHGAQGGDEEDYPDCRPGFMDKAAGAINRSLPDDQSIDLRTPLIGNTKEEVIQRADFLGVEFAYTYSCYEKTDPEDPDPCGECPACEERIDAFRRAGIDDPYMTEVES